MANVQLTLRNPLYRNWVKGGLVLKFTRDGLQCFVDDAVQDFQQRCLNDIWTKKSLAVGTVCNLCTTQNVLPCPTWGACAIRHGVCNYHDNIDPIKTYRPCPSGICNDLQNRICKSHRFHGPSWHDTNAQLWCTNSWEIAKCFMTAGGYTTVASAVQTDFPGLVSVVINLKDFQNIVVDNLSRKKNLFCQARTIRHDILHTATFELTDVVLNDYIDTMDLLLNDPGNLARDVNAQTAVTMLNQLKTDSMTVTNADEREIRDQALRAIDERKEEVIRSIEEKGDETKEKVKQEGLLQTTNIQEKAREMNEEVKEQAKQEGILQVTNIQEKAREMNEEVKEQAKEEGILQVTNIQEKGEKMKEEVKEEVKQDGLLQITNILEEKEKTIRHIQESKNKFTKALKTEGDVIAETKRQAYINEKKNLQVELIKLYREDYIKASIYPHRPEEEDTDINDIYVKPHLILVDLRSKQKGNKTDNKTVHSYKDILYKDSYPCKRIYLTAKAGMGKTTFCKRLISTWCIAHSENRDDDTDRNDDIYYEDIDDDKEVRDDGIYSEDFDDTSLENEQVMRKIPFLFYVSLRHAGSTSEIEEMIKDQLLLKRKHKALLDDILEEEPEQCLIILDGLDEWSPPEGHRQKLSHVTKALPARSATIGCSILTTTRPWKLDVLKLKPSEIDKQLECLGFNDRAADGYTRSVIAILNSRRGQNRHSADFRYELKKRKLDELITVPVLLKQLVCLWHAGKTLGNSKCPIYSEMISLMFELAETRLVDNPELSNIKEKYQNVQSLLPKCFNGLQSCQEFKSLIYYLSNLSFTTLMKKNEESTLVFDSSEVEIYGLSQSEIEICLKVGILSQSKVISAKCRRQKSFSFIHKIFQEFLAAVFVSVSRDSSGEIVETICSKINTVDDVLQQSEFLVFVSGMFPDILYQLTEHICRVTSHDAYKYKQSLTIRGYKYNPIYNISRLMTQCLLESKDNGYKTISMKLEDIFIDDVFTEVITPVIYANIGNIKSASIYLVETQDKIPGIIKDIKYLQKLLVNISCLNETVSAYCADIMKNSKDTLFSLSLVNVDVRSSYNFIPILVNDLIHLTVLRIHQCTCDDDAMTQLYEYVTRTTQLQEIVLYSINHYDCNWSGKLCQEIESRLDLSNHQQLTSLTLRHLNHVSTVTVNTSELQRCFIDTKYVELLECGAPNLEYLVLNFDLYLDPFSPHYIASYTDTQVHSLVIILPTLIQLKTVYIHTIDFGDRELLLSPEMKTLERVEILGCTMTSRAVCRFVDSIPHTQNSVIVKFWQLSITPAGKCDQCLQYIRSCSRFKVTRFNNTNIWSRYFPLGIDFHTVPIDSE